ncbi:hypothetical protein N7451_012472 [Penicillium sp. IBT 35674x]|nr:hypothetical protein N7451_012472 [Penicillium sp. IBT 35674x]
MRIHSNFVRSIEGECVVDRGGGRTNLCTTNDANRENQTTGAARSGNARSSIYIDFTGSDIRSVSQVVLGGEMS